MAKKDTKPTEARALVDLPQFGVQCGHVFAADAESIESLASIGLADPHPDAVAYAKNLQTGE